MDSERTYLTEKSSESSLSESWNVVDAQEVNNGSEGSDGESIEVIDEDIHNKESCQVDEPESNECVPVISLNDTEDCCNASHLPEEEELNQNQPEDVKVEVIGSPPPAHHNPPGGGINIYVGIAILAVLISFILSSAAVSLFLFKFGEFTLGHFKYLFPISSSSDKSLNEYQELLDQIKAYKKESQDLKGIVADLNAAVLNLRIELASKTLENKAQNNVNQNDEDDLFKQLLNVHKENSQMVKNDFGDTSEKNETLLTVMKDILKYFPENEERENSIETLRIFHLFPSYLKVLSTHYSTDENIKQFIDTWKEKLPVVNENLINDLKVLQLKMIKLTVKQLRKTERCFFRKLCSLKNFKKFDCYEVFMYFLKPYENSDTSSEEEILFGKPCLNENSEKKKDSHQLYSSKLNQNKKGRHERDEYNLDVQNAKYLNNDKKIIKTKSDDASSQKNDAKRCENSGGSLKAQSSPSKKPNHQNMDIDKVGVVRRNVARKKAVPRVARKARGS